MMLQGSTSTGVHGRSPTEQACPHLSNKLATLPTGERALALSNYLAVAMLCVLLVIIVTAPVNVNEQIRPHCGRYAVRSKRFLCCYSSHQALVAAAMPPRSSSETEFKTSKICHVYEVVFLACHTLLDWFLLLNHTCHLQHHVHTISAVPVAKSEFDIPAAPILIPKGPWKAVDGSVNAPKGFKAQGQKMYAAYCMWSMPTYVPQLEAFKHFTSHEQGLESPNTCGFESCDSACCCRDGWWAQGFRA